ncbi:MAG: clostripain-related cysteine peptidase [Clostridiales bacterium]|nr:clostripain-related cysteine peptidase [Clostridiales bacterium]
MKSLSILFYLDGNNEIEPEIYSSLQKLLGYRNNDVEIFIEVGREKREFARVLRPYEIIEESNDIWNGVRRYVLKDGVVKKIELGKINMAHPKELYDFICWGLKNSNSKQNILVIASHGFNFVGGIIDLTLDIPYIMSIEDMSYSINKALIDTRKKLDMLVLDMCYMNYIEIIYELSRRYSNIENILTYYGEGDFGGIDYVSMIENAYRILNKDNKIIDMLERDNLMLIKGNKAKLKEIKKYCDEFAKKSLDIGFLDIQEVKNSIGLSDIYNRLNSITCYKSKISKGVKIIDFYISEFDNIYRNLAFATNNHWRCLVAKSNQLIDSQTISFLPKKLTNSALIGLIMSLNVNIDTKQATKILNNVVKAKGWKI